MAEQPNFISQQSGPHYSSEPAPVSAQSASNVRMVSSERAMKPYAIFQTEIRSLARSSALSSMSFSFATGLTTTALKLYAAYATEMAWREDARRISNGNQFAMIVSAVTVAPKSEAWCGYWKRSTTK